MLVTKQPINKQLKSNSVQQTAAEATMVFGEVLGGGLYVQGIITGNNQFKLTYYVETKKSYALYLQTVKAK